MSVDENTDEVLPDHLAEINLQPQYAHIRQAVTKEIHTLMRKHRIRGASIALVDGQETVWAQGFGYADVEKKIPATASTVYRVGSISKLFTDTAVMQLAEQGKMDIDQPLADYVPDFSIRSRFPDVGPITPRNIMTHHSGLPGNYMKGMWGDAQADFAQLPSLIRNEYAAYPTNAIFAYSNLGLSLLGIALQNAGGEPFATYIDRHLLQPLGMSQSSFELTSTVQGLLSRGYDNGKACKSVRLRDLPAGGLYSSVEDLARFAKMVFAGGRSNDRQIIKAETLAEMLRPQNRDVPLDVGSHIGLGWIISGQDQFNGSGPVVWHTGGTFRFMSMLKLLPQHELGIVVLTNSKKGMALIDKVVTRTLRMALEQKTGVRQPGEDPVPKTTAARLSPEVIKAVPGYYATPVGPLLVKSRGERLYAVLGNRKLHVEPRDDGKFGVHFRLLGIFRIKGPLKAVTFSFRQIEGHDVLVAHAPSGSTIIGEKIALPAIPEVWRKRLGHYEVLNPDAGMPIDRVRLKERHQALQIEVRLTTLARKPVVMTLLPLSATEAVIAGLGRGQGETIHATERDGTTYLSYSGFEFQVEK